MKFSFEQKATKVTKGKDGCNTSYNLTGSFAVSATSHTIGISRKAAKTKDANGPWDGFVECDWNERTALILCVIVWRLCGFA
jgi:hypothetical protein